MLLSTAFASIAQEKQADHSIKVFGTAEMEIVPDEIYMSLTLKEYTKDKRKFTVEELEKNLVNYIEKVTLTDKKEIKMDNMSAYMINMKRKNKDEVISKSYDIKFKNPQQVYQVYTVMDSLGISNAYVSKYSHSKMDEYKKQVKINAIKAARDKANYLLEAISEKAGKALSVTETSGNVFVNDGINNNGNNRNTYYQSNMNVRFLGSDDELSGGSNAESIGDKTIKLSYSIQAEFAIQ